MAFSHIGQFFKSLLSAQSASKTTAYLKEKTRKWQLWQVESSLACNLKCIMCPWEGERFRRTDHPFMTQETWNSITPYLNDVRSIDFTGGGEPLLQKNLLLWISQARSAGCETGFLTNGLLLDEGLSRKFIETGLSWIGFSLDGTDKPTYESIRKGSDFQKVCANISYLTSLQNQNGPKVMINFVIMVSNAHQIMEMVSLAHQLKVNQLNFKQCDVSRGEFGKNLGLFKKCDPKQIRLLTKTINKARRLASKYNITATAYSFIPEEQAFCDQDLRNSLFIRYDGSVSPCINQAYGGLSTFLGEEIDFPEVIYGNVQENTLHEIWDSPACVTIRKAFELRNLVYNQTLASSDYGNSLHKLNQAFRKATQAMPEAPKGCRTCHYLYNILS